MQFKPPPPIPDDRQPIPEPKSQKINIVADIIAKQFADQIEQSLDLSRQLRNISGNRKQAYNVDAFGEVPNSSWFTNRNATKRMSIAAIERGPNAGPAPAMDSTCTIIRAKTEGVTPGFHVRDGRGVRYVMKFDPMGHSEMATGAELVGTKLFYAAGYNVPQNYLVFFDSNILRIGENVEIKDKQGITHKMATADMDTILARIEKVPDGHIRAVASRYVRGKLKGPFYYKGTRKDDPNDFIPHQHRRELRGLRVMAAWLNHFDTKANNTLDVYDPAGYMKHYLIDFGSTLGSQGDEPMPPYIGYEESFDLHEILKSTATLGLNVEPWEKVKGIEFPSIGHYQFGDFHPQKYKFILPNPAFELMTNLDGYWGAKLVMSFTDDQIRAAVATAQYSNPEAADYLIRTIIERRNIIGRYWFSKMPPIDHFEIRTNEQGVQLLCFKDLAIESGLSNAEATRYSFYLRLGDKIVEKGELAGSTTCVNLPSMEIATDGVAGQYIEFHIRLKRSEHEKWSQWVRAYLQYEMNTARFLLVGVKRQE
ncbi:MAG: hypothetical protein ACE5I1_07210 [bacterium]